MHILSVAEMQEYESAADAAGHSYDRMMELAGQGVARAILERMSVKNRRALVLVGPGNNGGDGLVAARYLKDAGAYVTAYLSRERDKGKDPVYRQAVERGVTVVNLEDDPDGSELRRLVTKSHLLIDALLGTGSTPPLRGAIEEILEEVGRVLLANANHPPLVVLNRPPQPERPRPFVVAVDGPSGMDFDAGEVDPKTLEAHLTVTFAAPKLGQFRFPAANHTGELVVADIGVPQEVAPPPTDRRVLTPAQVQAWLPRRSAGAHKGTFGKALIVAGSANYTGAAALSATAATRAGAGLVTLGLASSLHDAIVPLVPEATYLLLPSVLGAISPAALELLEGPFKDYDALLLGPGLGRAEETTAFVHALFGTAQQKRSPGFVVQSEPARQKQVKRPPPLVIDADGLNILSETQGWPDLLPEGTILTPHPGEMARLAGSEVEEVQEDRWKAATQHARAWGHVVVLKGAFTVVAAPDGRAVLLPFANAGLATAGTGDVLAGIIVALRAQGLEAFEAAAAGAYVHGLAGEMARDERGMAGMVASDVAEALPKALRLLEGDE
jgi:NAD(P)H-hydrate epimerase